MLALFTGYKDTEVLNGNLKDGISDSVLQEHFFVTQLVSRGLAGCLTNSPYFVMLTPPHIVFGMMDSTVRGLLKGTETTTHLLEHFSELSLSF